jgi:hypothetical protein
MRCKLLVKQKKLYGHEHSSLFGHPNSSDEKDFITFVLGDISAGHIAPHWHQDILLSGANAIKLFTVVSYDFS